MFIFFNLSQEWFYIITIIIIIIIIKKSVQNWLYPPNMKYINTNIYR